MEVTSPGKRSLCGGCEVQNMQGVTDIAVNGHEDDSGSNCSFQTPRTSVSSETRDSEIQTDFSWIRCSGPDENLKLTPISLWSSCDKGLSCAPKGTSDGASFERLKRERGSKKPVAISLGIKPPDVWCTDSYLSDSEESITSSESSCESDDDTIYAVETEVLSPPSSPFKRTFSDSDRVVAPVTYQVVVNEEVTNVIYHVDKTECVVYGLRRHPAENSEYVPDTINVNITETQTQTTNTSQYSKSDEHVHFTNDDIDSDTENPEIIHKKSRKETHDAISEGDKTQETHVTEEDDIHFIDLPATSTPRPVHIDIPEGAPGIDPCQLCSPKDSDTTSDYGTIAPENENRTDPVSACLNSSDEREQRDSPLHNNSGKFTNDSDLEKSSECGSDVNLDQVDPTEEGQLPLKNANKTITDSESDEEQTEEQVVTTESVRLNPNPQEILIRYIDTQESDTASNCSDNESNPSDDINDVVTAPENKIPVTSSNVDDLPHRVDNEETKNKQMDPSDTAPAEHAIEEHVVPVRVEVPIPSADIDSILDNGTRPKIGTPHVRSSNLLPDTHTRTPGSSRGRSFSDSAIDTSYTEYDSPGLWSDADDEKDNDLSDGEIPHKQKPKSDEGSQLSDGEVTEESIVPTTKSKSQLPNFPKYKIKPNKKPILHRSVSDNSINRDAELDILNNSEDSIIFVFVNQQDDIANDDNEEDDDDNDRSQEVEDVLSSSVATVQRPVDDNDDETDDVPLRHRYGIDEDVLPMTDKSVSLDCIPQAKQLHSYRLCRSCDCLSPSFVDRYNDNDAENNEGIFPPCVDDIQDDEDIISDEISEDILDRDNFRYRLNSPGGSCNPFDSQKTHSNPVFIVPKMESKKGQNPFNTSTNTIPSDQVTISLGVKGPKRNRKRAHSDSDIDAYERAIALKLSKETDDWEDLSTTLLKNAKFIEELKTRLPGTNFLSNFETPKKDYSTQTSGSLTDLQDLSIQTDDVERPKLTGFTQTDTTYTHPRKHTDIETLEIMPDPSVSDVLKQQQSEKFRKLPTSDSGSQTDRINISSPDPNRSVNDDVDATIVTDHRIDHHSTRRESYSQNTDTFDRAILVEREVVYETEAMVPDMEYTNEELSRLKEEHGRMMESLDKVSKEREHMTNSLKSKLVSNKKALKNEIERDLLIQSNENLHKTPSNSSYEKVSDLDMSIPIQDPIKMDNFEHIIMRSEPQNMSSSTERYEQDTNSENVSSQHNDDLGPSKPKRYSVVDTLVTEGIILIEDEEDDAPPKPSSHLKHVPKMSNRDRWVQMSEGQDHPKIMIDEVIQTDQNKFNNAMQADELTQTDDVILKLDLSKLDTHVSPDISPKYDSLQNKREARDRIEFIEQVPMNYLPPSLTVERLEAKLNYSIGETDSCIKSIQDNWNNTDRIIENERTVFKENISNDNTNNIKRNTHQRRPGLKKPDDRSARTPHKKPLGKDKTKTLLKLRRQAEIEAFRIERLLEEQRQKRNKMVNSVDASSMDYFSDRKSQVSSPNSSFIASPRLMTPKDHREHMVSLRRKLVQATEVYGSPRESRSCSPRSHLNDTMDSPRLGYHSPHVYSPTASPRLTKGKLQTPHLYQQNTPTSSRSRSYSPDRYYLDEGRYVKTSSPVLPQKRPTSKLTTSSHSAKKPPMQFDRSYDSPNTMSHADIDMRDLLMELRNTRIMHQQEISRVHHTISSYDSDYSSRRIPSLPRRPYYSSYDDTEDSRSVASSDGTMRGSYELYDKSIYKPTERFLSPKYAS